MAEQLRKLREASEKLRMELQPNENLITQYSRPLEPLKTEGIVDGTTTEEDLKTQIARSRPEFDRLSRELDAAAKAWRVAWSAYQSQLKLLDLDVKDAAAAKEMFLWNQTLVKQRLMDPPEAIDTQAKLNAATFKDEKAQKVLRMWQELENNEPELNPDWNVSSSSTTAESTQEQTRHRDGKTLWPRANGTVLCALLRFFGAMNRGE